MTRHATTPAYGTNDIIPHREPRQLILRKIAGVLLSILALSLVQASEPALAGKGRALGLERRTDDCVDPCAKVHPVKSDTDDSTSDTEDTEGSDEEQLTDDETEPSPEPSPTTDETDDSVETASSSPEPTFSTQPVADDEEDVVILPEDSSGIRWGMMGGFGGVDLDDLASRGVRVVDLVVYWRSAEPTPDGFDESYFDRKRAELDTFRSKGFEVILNFGMHHAPSWFFDLPNSHYVNQHGATYLNSDEPNLIWATEHRWLAERYIEKVFSELGTDFVTVRTGGGHWGELTYPAIVNPSTGKIYNYYWAFDGAAARTNPVPGWKPGQPSPAGEAATFVIWYIDALTSYQNWQVAAVRRHYPGWISVLYPSWGLRVGDLAEAVETNLDGTSSPEINGEVQRGFEHAYHVTNLTDPKAAVWGTWADKLGTLSWLSTLAEPEGRRLFGENSGSDDVTKMDNAMSEAQRLGLTALMWVRAEEAYCRCNGYATIEQYQERIASSSS